MDRSGRAGSPGLVLFLAFCLVATAASYSVLPQDDAGRLTLGLLALLGFVGLVALFFFAVGFLQFSGHVASNDVVKLASDGAPEGLLVAEPDGRVLYANETYLALSGAKDGIGVKGIERLFAGSSDVSEAVYRLVQAAREGKRAVEEMRLSPALAGGGPVGWYRVRVRPIAHGRNASVWTVAEVTRERERHENVFQELRHAIDYLDHAPAGFFSAEADGRISYINATLTGWLDYDLAQVGSGGLHLTDLIAADGGAMLTAMAGQAGEVKTEQFDIDLKRRNGQRLPVRLLHRVAFSQDREPGPSRTLVINRARGEAPGEDLRASEVRFARLFHSTPMAIATVDGAGLVTEANAAFARLFGEELRGAASAGGWPITRGVVEADRPALQSAIAAAVAGASDVASVDAALVGAGLRAARFFVSADEETDGVPKASLFVLDTSDQRTLQESFVQAQKMQAIGQLAGGVAHDFNNVLTAIIGYSDLLLANHRATDPSFNDIMQIKQNAMRAAGLVRQLLAFSRRQTLRLEVLQIGDTLADLQNLTRKLVGEKIEIDVRQGRDLWPVKADVIQLEQVIINLVVNARDAMPDGGRVTVRTRNVDAVESKAFNEVASAPAADFVLIEVEDTGQGIPPEVLPKIFEPFFTTKEVGKGTGLGLSTVYGIIKQTGGFIFCESRMGVGTVFRILLPRHRAPATAAVEDGTRKEAAKAVGADLTGRGTILLVEDEEAVRAFSARALTSRGYTVLEAASGADALQVVAEHDVPPDIIVSDVVMPEMDGPTMLGQLRQRGVTAKIIFVSGYAEDAFEKNLPEGQDFAFLPKPFTLVQLVEKVKQSMEADAP